jgi:hypothetical protein
VEVDEFMIVLGADTHKRSHTIAAVSDATGELLGEQTVQVGATWTAPGDKHHTATQIPPPNTNNPTKVR